MAEMNRARLDELTAKVVSQRGKVSCFWHANIVADLIAAVEELVGALDEASQMIALLERVADFWDLPGTYPMDGKERIDALLARYRRNK